MMRPQKMARCSIRGKRKKTKPHPAPQRATCGTFFLTLVWVWFAQRAKDTIKQVAFELPRPSTPPVPSQVYWNPHRLGARGTIQNEKRNNAVNISASVRRSWQPDAVGLMARVVRDARGGGSI
jgi:hypothetical protein